MSKSVTKARIAFIQPMRNRMIPRFSSLRSKRWRLLCLWTWVTVLCQDIGDTSVGSGGDTCGLRLSGEL